MSGARLAPGHSHRCCQGPLYRPAPCDARAQRGRTHSQADSPRFDGVRDAPVCQRMRSSRVRDLLAPRRPAAVSRLIRAGLIRVPVERMVPGWLRPHVYQERLEAVYPSPADRNAATAVIAVLGCVRVQAPALHRTPGAVLGSQGAAVGAGRAGAIPTKTPTRDDQRSPERGNSHEGLPAAIAGTKPIATLRHVSDHKESPEALAREVREVSRHSRIIARPWK